MYLLCIRPRFLILSIGVKGYIAVSGDARCAACEEHYRLLHYWPQASKAILRIPNEQARQLRRCQQQFVEHLDKSGEISRKGEELCTPALAADGKPSVTILILVNSNFIHPHNRYEKLPRRQM